MCTPHPQKALNNEKCHLCKMQEMSMPACECALCMYLCVHFLCVYMWWCGWILKMCVQFCGYVSARGWMHACRDRGVCKGVYVYDDGKAGLLSFNIVLVGHWAMCTELTAQAQSTPRPPSHILNPNRDSSFCPVKQRHKHRHGPGCLWSNMSSLLMWWWFVNCMH